MTMYHSRMNIFSRAYGGLSCYGINLCIYPRASTGVTKPKINKRETDIQLIVPFQCLQGSMPLGIGNETHCLNNGGDTEPIQIINHINERTHLLFKRRLRDHSFHT